MKTTGNWSQVGKLVCGHSYNAAREICDLKITACVECQPFDYYQCDWCYLWYSKQALQPRGSSMLVCAECLKALVTEEQPAYMRPHWLLTAAAVLMMLVLLVWWRV